MKKDFLLEIGTAELPPNQIDGLVGMLADNLKKNLKELHLDFAEIKTYSSPRRLAVLISDLDEKQEDQPLELRGPNIEIAFDKAGKPTKAATKFAEACETDVSNLSRIEDKKGVYLFHKAIKKGKPTKTLLSEAIIGSIKKIHPRRAMRWGNNIGPFVRPVYWIVAIFGKEIVPLEIFGIKSSNKTLGHRFHHPKPITISSPNKYEKLLEEKGFVIADKDKRKQKIKEQITKAIKSGHAEISQELLEEVTDIVEWPVALVGTFDERFLKIPQEALITTMKVHQRCFPIFDSGNKLSSKFIIVSNIESKDPKQVIDGNERVIRARLSDAEFFYQLDLKHKLEDNLEKLKEMAFQKNLGSIYDKTMRLQALAPFVAEKIGANSDKVKRAALLSKCDLITSMVWEFPELQGIMGYHYAKSTEDKEIATAIKEQYLPRFAKDEVPTTKTGSALALADRIDSLVGFFVTAKNPSSDKDPLGLRRLATGIANIILENNFSFDLKELLEKSIATYGDLIKTSDDTTTKLLGFIFDRLRYFYVEQNINPAVFRAVLAVAPTDIVDFNQRLEAVDVFNSNPESADLVEIYKRIKNILSKSDVGSNQFDPSLTTEEAEKNLAKEIAATKKSVSTLYQNKDYLMILKELAKLKSVLADFFDTVIVMSDDEKIRNNRLALLKELYDLFMLVADLSCLVSG